jgi:hypothetical protein
LGDRDESEVVEGDPDRPNVVDGAECDWIRPKSDGNARGVDGNTPCRDPGPGGHSGRRAEPGEVEANQERESGGDGGDTDGRRGRMDSATSGARRESKRLETRPLAENETDQRRQYKRTTSDVPRPSIPPAEHPRSPTDYVDPPRRRGRIKTNPRKVRSRSRAYQVTQSRRGRIGRIGAIAHVVYGVERMREQCRGATREDEATGVD